jgi:hypothetical protein
MLQELEIFQGVDFPLDCCLVDIILLQLSKNDLCRFAISISNRKRSGEKKKKTKTKPSQICKKYLGIDLASAFTLLTAAEEKKLSSKTSEKLQCTAIVMLRHRFSTTALYFRRRDRGGDRDLEEVMT